MRKTDRVFFCRLGYSICYFAFLENGMNRLVLAPWMDVISFNAQSNNNRDLVYINIFLFLAYTGGTQELILNELYYVIVINWCKFVPWITSCYCWAYIFEKGQKLGSGDRAGDLVFIYEKQMFDEEGFAWWSWGYIFVFKWMCGSCGGRFNTKCQLAGNVMLELEELTSEMGGNSYRVFIFRYWSYCNASSIFFFKINQSNILL